MTKDTVEVDKSTLTILGVIVLVILLVLAIFTGGFGLFNNTGNSIRDRDNPAPINMEALIENDAINGDENAPVTIVEFSDYECPFCQRYYEQTYGQIKENYIETGQVKYVFRDFPLDFHQNAQKAAEAAECAGEQGQYYDMHDKLFEEGVDQGVESFKQYAADLGLDTEEFNECLDSGQMASEVRQDLLDGQNAGVRGTPAFFINGEQISGAQPYSVFQDAIERALAQ